MLGLVTLSPTLAVAPDLAPRLSYSWVDLVVGNGDSSGQGQANELYHNLQNGTFESLVSTPITVDTAISTSVAWGGERASSERWSHLTSRA